MTFPEIPGSPIQDTQPTEAFEAQPSIKAGFCQQCGVALNEQTRRSVGGAVYCEPCLQARLNSVPGYTTVAQPYVPWPPVAGPGLIGLPGQPNPILAGWLGFIPGVGAMYNEQYAKGIAHLAIFSLLVVFADSNGIFGLGIAGWEFYMAIEAYHTARARREGLPLPNPFGFNDLGERLGFGQGWSAPAPVPSAQAVAPFTPVYSYPAEPFDPSAASPGQPWPQPVPFSSVSSAGVAVPPGISSAPASMTRFPASAIWLIVLGFVFLLSTTGLFRRFSGEALLAWSLIAFSGWLFLRRLREVAASSLSTLGRVSHALQGTIWIFTVGVLALLDAFTLLKWGRSWPIFLIVAGGLALISRLASPSGVSADTPADISADPATDSFH